MVEAPRVTAPASFEVTGWVADVSRGARGKRVLLHVTAIDGPAYALKQGKPERVRISVPKESPVKVGSTISLSARLFPPAGPALPGGYDFSFIAYFQKIGASGFAFGYPVEVSGASSRGRVSAFMSALAGVRASLSERLLEFTQTPDAGALVAALLVGNRDHISDETEDVLRQAGLAHILAISGLHMALFAGGAYSLLVMQLALSPRLALTQPIHQFAALGALVAATLYLLISGASVATQRSYIMIALVFLGVLVGRRGLTLRSVAIAGLALLIIAPEDLFHPGFQMSFAAVLCLVAAYEALRERKSSKEKSGGPLTASGPNRGFLTLISKWAGGLILTSLIAGLATGMVGAYHFGRIAPYGLVGNILGMPIFSLVTMPMGLLALLLLPFGLASFPVSVMEASLSLILQMASFTADLDAGRGYVLPPPAASAFLLFCGLFGGLVLRGRLRCAALLPVLLGSALWGLSSGPDIQISASGLHMAARDAEGVLRLTSTRQGFRNEMWLQREGKDVSELANLSMADNQKRCDDEGCVVHAFPTKGAPNPLIIALPRSISAAIEDCTKADLVITDFDLSESVCKALLLDASKREQTGAVSIWLSQIKPNNDTPSRTGVERIENAKSIPARPWHQ